MDQAFLEKVRAAFRQDTFATGAGMEVASVSEEAVVCEMAVTGAHRNAGGGIQGGAIYTLADLAFAVHSNLPVLMGTGEGVTLGQSSHISYLKASRGAKLTARSHCLSRGRNVCVFRVEVTDDLGVRVAECTFNGFVNKSVTTFGGKPLR